MTDTTNLSLPLVQPSQAQKHVTVNEALARLDGLAQLTLLSVSQTIPPVAPVEGTAFAVPTGAVNAWAGQEGSVAVVVGGGWVFVPARRGWRAFVLDAGEPAVFDGTDWRLGAATVTPGGATLNIRSVEADIALTAGATLTTTLSFPARCIAFGVTGRVISALSGTLTSWEVGVAGDTARYGSGLGLPANSWVNGPGAPLVYWTATPLVLTADGGDFAAGELRLVLHYAELSLPFTV